jgi:hypothetical protein
MSMYAEGRGLASEIEPFGLLTEGAAGIVAIVLSVVALAGVSVPALTSIAAIVVGGGLMAQAFNSAAEQSRVATTATTGSAGEPPRRTELRSEMLVDVLCGLAGLVLGILALVGVAAPHLLAVALIVFGGGLLVGGAAAVGSPATLAASGMEVLIGLAAIVLGILAIVMGGVGILVPVGLLAVGAALVLVSAAFSGAVVRLFAG